MFKYGEKGKEIFGYLADYTVFDLETTGLDTDKDMIVEIGAVKVRDHEIVDRFETLVNPAVEIPHEVIDVHGISGDMVKDAPNTADALFRFDQFIGDDVLIGQNIVHFDMPFIWRLSQEHYKRYISNDYIDNRLIAKVAYHDMENPSGKALSELFGLDRTVVHRGLGDSVRCFEAYERCGKQLASALRQTYQFFP